MRTTLTIEDQLASELKRASLESGRSFKDLLNEALRVGLKELKRPESRRYRLDAVSLGKTRPGVDLAKALDLADALEDEAIREKLEQRK
jgi:hypothetical protein